MADNLVINTGTAGTVATEDISGAHHQKMRLTVGASGTSTFLVVGQSSMTASLPVVVASDQSTLSVNVVAFTPGGTQNVSVVNTPVVTATISNSPLICTASGVTVASIATGTVNIVGAIGTVSTVSTVLGTLLMSASGTGNVTIAGTPTVTVSTALAFVVSTVTTLLGTVAISGTVSPLGTQDVIIIGTPVVTATISSNPVMVSGSGLALAALPSGTGVIGRIELVHHDSRISGAISTATVGNVILITSGGYTLYIQDIVISPSTSMNVTIFSAATTAIYPLYFATQGGTHLRFMQPLKLNTAQSLTFTPSVAASVSMYAAGYTIT